jgi:hypothetical protein
MRPGNAQFSQVHFTLFEVSEVSCGSEKLGQYLSHGPGIFHGADYGVLPFGRIPHSRKLCKISKRIS